METSAMLFLNIQEEIEECRRILREEFNSDIELIKQIGDHVLQRPGKMLRPAIVIASAKICGCTNTVSMARVAAVLEILHNATLIHDDSIDHASTRRGQVTINQKWDHQSAVLMGDYLYAKALNIFLKEDNLEMMKILGEAIISMCEAEMYQIQVNFNPDISEENHIKLIEGKTAALVAVGCRLGAILGRADEQLKQAFVEFGMRIGTAFQIVDDLFDYTADSGQVGKPVGHDLREGKVTLPLIYALQQAKSTERITISRLILNRSITPEVWLAIKSFVGKYNGIEYARNRASQLIREGLSFAAAFPQSLFKLSMIHLARYVLKRVR